MTANAVSIVPAIAAIGFAIQQFLQVFGDPAASVFLEFAKSKYGKDSRDGTRSLPGGIADADAKKALLGAMSLALGLIIAGSVTGLGVLAYAGVNGQPMLDWFVTALTLSAGTEGANSVVKLAQYAKDGVKSISTPSTAQSAPAALPAAMHAQSANGFDPALAGRIIDLQSRAKEDGYEC